MSSIEFSIHELENFASIVEDFQNKYIYGRTHAEIAVIFTLIEQIADLHLNFLSKEQRTAIRKQVKKTFKPQEMKPSHS